MGDGLVRSEFVSTVVSFEIQFRSIPFLFLTSKVELACHIRSLRHLIVDDTRKSVSMAGCGGKLYHLIFTHTLLIFPIPR